MENIRFNDELNLEISVDPRLHLSAIKVPPLLLQPFVENAIWHGLSVVKNKQRELHINVVDKDENCIQISIFDNGIGRKRAQEIKSNKVHRKDSLGQKIAEERLKVFSTINNKGANLTIKDHYEDDGSPKGTEVIISLEK